MVENSTKVRSIFKKIVIRITVFTTNITYSPVKILKTIDDALTLNE